MRRSVKKRIQLSAIVGIVGLSVWGVMRITGGGDSPQGSDVATARPDTLNQVASTGAIAGPVAEESNSSRQATKPKEKPPVSNETTLAQKKYEDGLKALQNDDPIMARSLLNEALHRDPMGSFQDNAREKLTRLGEETIFSGKCVKGDPLTSFHVMGPGELLVHLERKFRIPYKLIMRCNSIANERRVRAGQRLKIAEGPFHAIIDKSDFRLDLFLKDVFVKSFIVGLGADDSTPTGEWIVKDKVPNPRYYPPRGGKIIEADDPSNPLAEHWISLEGVKGEAVGQSGYGIHGTIEPESIGKQASMGCVRMRNPDVSLIFDVLLVNHSRVTIRE
jgi:hypothetical protein